jgi:carbon-monoxide dehydrogenase large subunit
MADYLVPLAAEMPDIEVGHLVSPTADSELGAKGAGEAGTAGATGAVANAVNDALRALGARAIMRCRSRHTESVEGGGKEVDPAVDLARA